MVRHWKVIQWLSVLLLAALVAMFVAGWYIAAIGVLLVLVAVAVSLIEELPDQPSRPTKPRS